MAGQIASSNPGGLGLAEGGSAEGNTTGQDPTRVWEDILKEAGLWA